jgi:pimeloyl-ACP methyl ester carboxylesterase
MQNEKKNEIAKILTSRRALALAVIASGAVSLTSPVRAQTQPHILKPATFVLVHGAWHGGWCYARVANILRAKGHIVFTPSLTGLGDRSHLFNGNISLSSHVSDMINTIEAEELGNIILCGHSYGGMVISGVASAIPSKIASIVYLDAFLPNDNQSLMDVSGDVAAIQRRVAEASQLGGIALPPVPAAVFGVNEKDRAWVDRRCTKQPFATFVEKTKSSMATIESIKRKHYIMATGYLKGGLFRWAYDKVKDNPTWTTETFTCGHDVMIDQPELLAASLEKAAS